MCDLSVVLICRNDSTKIKQCDDELDIVLPSLGLDVELIYVDNGSVDDTVDEIRHTLTHKQSTFPKKLIVLRRFVGNGNAFMAAVENSSGRFVLTLDVGLTIDPLESVRMIDEIEQGYDLVTGWRQRDHLPSLIRWRSTLVNQITSYLTGVFLNDYGTPFRMFRREILDQMEISADLHAFSPVFAHLAGARISEIKVTYRPDYYIKPEYTTTSFVSSAFDLLTLWFISRYANRPMGLLGKISLLFASIGGIGFALALADKNSDTRRDKLILSLVSGSVGIQTLLMGLNLELLLHKNYSAREAIIQNVIEVFEITASAR